MVNEKLVDQAGDLADVAGNLDTAITCNQPIDVSIDIAEQVEAMATAMVKSLRRIKDAGAS